MGAAVEQVAIPPTKKVLAPTYTSLSTTKVVFWHEGKGELMIELDSWKTDVDKVRYGSQVFLPEL